MTNSDDRTAWQEFAEIYQPLIFELAIARGLQKADAEDVTQEVMASVAKNLENWSAEESRNSFRAWLATITRNQTFLFFRKRSRQPETGLDSRLGQHPMELNEREFDLARDQQLFVWAARKIQSRFQAATWRAFWLTAVEGKSPTDVAVELNKFSLAQSG